MNNVRLFIHGMGHVPSFKNSKMLCRGNLITDPKKRAWMDAATDSLESQLRCVSRIIGDGMQTAHCLQSLIACATQFDDSVQWVPELHVRAVKCAKGDEGADIVVTLL